MTEIKYELIAGSLPVNVTLNEDTGEIIGDIDFVNVDLGPTWNSPAPGKLGDFDEGDTISITFNATYDTNNEPARMGILNNGNNLPWGAVFDPDTRTLSGTFAPLLVREGFSNSEPPIWQTRFGNLITVDEGTVVTNTVAANPRGSKTIDRYAVVGGGLPWGLELDTATGVIGGTTADLKDPGATVEVPKLPVPVFSLPSGRIATLNEGEVVSDLIIFATPAEDRQITKYTIIRNGLPRGLQLNFVTGQITGTVAETIGVNEPPFFFTDLYPTLSSDVVVNGSTVTTNLGSFSRGDVVSAQFSATPTAGRTIFTYSTDKGLPRGLTMSSSGQITGTISNHATLGAQSGTYTFTVRVTDNQYGFATQTFNITVL